MYKVKSFENMHIQQTYFLSHLVIAKDVTTENLDLILFKEDNVVLGLRATLSCFGYDFNIIIIFLGIFAIF